MTEAQALSPAALRKQQERERDEALGLERVELKWSRHQADIAAFMCRVRAGHGEAYTLREYLDTLVRRDYERFKAEWAELGDCANCQRPLPLGCAGRLAMESACWHVNGIKALLL